MAERTCKASLPAATDWRARRGCNSSRRTRSIMASSNCATPCCPPGVRPSFRRDLLRHDFCRLLLTDHVDHVDGDRARLEMESELLFQRLHQDRGLDQEVSGALRG